MDIYGSYGYGDHMESHGHDMAEKTENGEGLRRKRGGTAVQLLWVMVSC